VKFFCSAVLPPRLKNKRGCKFQFAPLFIKLKSKSMKTKVNETSLKYLGNMRIKESPKISSSHDAFEKFYYQWNLNHIAMQECFKLMLLNNGNRVKV
jgi:hypothetical protein